MRCLSLATHLRYGKVDPERLDPNWNLTDPKRLTELQLKLRTALESGSSIRSALQEMRPEYFKYGLQREALARYRLIEQSGGWPVVPGGPWCPEGWQSDLGRATPVFLSFGGVSR